jgi:cell division protein FtsB
MKCDRCGKDNPAPVHTCTAPTAIYLAEVLEQFPTPHDKQAAAELRRLHAENEALREALTRLLTDEDYAEAERQARAALARAGEKT